MTLSTHVDSSSHQYPESASLGKDYKYIYICLPVCLSGLRSPNDWQPIGHGRQTTNLSPTTFAGIFNTEGRGGGGGKSESERELEQVE